MGTCFWGRVVQGHPNFVFQISWLSIQNSINAKIVRITRGTFEIEGYNLKARDKCIVPIVQTKTTHTQKTNPPQENL